MELVEADRAAVTPLKGTEDDISIVPLTATSTVTGAGNAKIFSGPASPLPRGPASVKSFTALPPIVEDNQYHQHSHPLFPPLPEYISPSVFHEDSVARVARRFILPVFGFPHWHRAGSICQM